jgi:hypothetical protein
MKSYDTLATLYILNTISRGRANIAHSSLILS